MAKHAPQKSFQEVDSGYCRQRVTMEGTGERVPPSAAKQINTVEVKEELLRAWGVSLGSSEIHNGQHIRTSPRVCGPLEANRLPAHLQTPTPQHSQDSTLKTQVYIRSSNKQKEAWPVRHHPDGPSRVYPDKVNLPSQDSLPRFQTRGQNPKTSQGLCDVFMRTHERVDTQENRVPKKKILIWDHNKVYPHEERQGTIRSRALSHGEKHERVKPSIPSSTHVKDTAKSQIPEKGEATSKSSWKNIPRYVLQYGKHSTKYTGLGDSLKIDHPPPAAEHTQGNLTRKMVIYRVIAELQSIMDDLFPILEDTVRGPIKRTRVYS